METCGPEKHAFGLVFVLTQIKPVKADVADLGCLQNPGRVQRSDVERQGLAGR
ncbi:MAG: hypothetical protein AAFN80_15470 [Pseudomonadota bacterium]